MDVLGFDRRRLGTAMLVFGLVGMVLAGLITVALASGAVAARNLDDRLQADQDRIAASLTRLSQSMESLAQTADHASTTLQTSSDTLAEAKTTLQSVADTSVAMADALNVSIFGSQPFGAASERLQDMARKVTAFQQKAEALATNLHTNAGDASAMSSQVHDLQKTVGELAARVSDFDRLGEIVTLLLGGIVLAALLTAWVFVGATFCAFAGVRMRRIAVVVVEEGSVPPA